MKQALLAAAAAGLLSASAWAQPYGMGPGMMGGYGYGPGYGMGPGMMGGYGPGYGMGPGMMGGYGPGYGMGPGMMGGYGMGPGMMWGGGYGGYGIPNLTDEQRTKLGKIEDEFRQKQFALMQSMHGLMWKDSGIYRDGKFDENAARKAYDEMANLRKQMFENSLAERKQIDSVLTPEQREQMTPPAWRKR